MIRYLIVGHSRGQIYANAFYTAWKKHNHNVYIFNNQDYDVGDKEKSLLARFENKYMIGPDIRRLNRELIQYVDEIKPDVVFFYLDRAIRKRTILELKKRGVLLINYVNDNPWSNYYPWYFWRNYKQSLPYMDMVYVYREENIEDCKKRGAENVSILRSYYIHERNYYISNPKTREYVPRVVFLGHYENDGREDYINALLENGIEVGIPAIYADKYKESKNKVLLKYTMDDYNEEMNASEIALVFLSSINHDTYTRRCFEIPATKTLMMSVYTDDIASLYKEDEECVFFRNPEELVKKTNYYLDKKDEAKRIAEAGYDRLKREGHEIVNRIEQVERDAEKILNKK